MAKKKYYAVRKGMKTGIFTDWSECRNYVFGYPGAEYKSFTDRKSAEAFMTSSVGCTDDAPREGAAVAYVDGSYRNDTNRFSYGAVLFVDGETKEMSHAYDNPEYAQLRNVAGEITGAASVMKYCIANGIEKVDIYHDYTGIAKWCTGEWKTNNTVTARYRAFYDTVKDKLDVRFVKVKGHSGDKYNDRADELAKSALGIV